MYYVAGETDKTFTYEYLARESHRLLCGTIYMTHKELYKRRGIACDVGVLYHHHHDPSFIFILLFSLLSVIRISILLFLQKP